MSSQPPKAFISYAHEDSQYKEQLVVHLQGLIQQNVIASWQDGLLIAGQQWNNEIVKHLDTSRLILLLISPYFIASDYINNTELKRASERYTREEVCVIPILVRNVHGWKGKPFGELTLGDFQALPSTFEFIVDWKNADAAFADVVEGIEQAVKNLKPVHLRVGLPIIPRPPVVGFVARRDEQGRDIVERLKEELAPQGNQLVTLLGPGGIGKTTLAAEAARALKEVFGGRIVWSSAEKRADFTISTLLDDVATQLGQEGLRTLAPDAKSAQVYALVADAPTLIVLDNYETIVPEAKKPVEDWFTLAGCSALFTSRHRINSTRKIVIAAMSREEAQDYLERLMAQTQDVQIFSKEVRRRIYETAEANPYVMQWVVAQIDAAQEPRAVLEELTQGEGDAAERVFDRSFNLLQLGDDGRATLLALSLFVPSATREALAAVAGFGDDSQRVNEAVKNLRALWLIKGLDENRRFTVEGLTRSLARARLSKDERVDEFRQRFVTHFLNYAEAHAQTTPEDFDALEEEKDNVLNAMDMAIDLMAWESVQKFANVLASPVTGMLIVHGYWDEAIKRNEQARDAMREMKLEHEIAIYSHNAGIIRQNRGEYDAARIANEEALAIYRRLNQEANVSVALHQLGILAQSQGEIEEARRLYNESLEIEKRLGNQSGIAITIHQLAMLAQDEGEVEEARRLYNESLEIEKRLGNQSGIASTLHQLGRLAEIDDNKVEAARLFREALGVWERLKSPDVELARQSLERVEAEAS